MDLEAYKNSDEEIYEAWKNGKSTKVLSLITSRLEHEIIRIIREQDDKQKEK
jgi:hypothetical protein